MKTYLVFNLLILFLSFSLIRAQEKEIFVINESNIIFLEIHVKSTQDSEWSTVQLEQNSEDFFQSFTIPTDSLRNCIIDIKAVDETNEYYWDKINACNAIEISIYIEDDGSTGYTVTYQESEENDEEIDY